MSTKKDKSKNNSVKNKSVSTSSTTAASSKPNSRNQRTVTTDTTSGGTSYATAMINPGSEASTVTLKTTQLPEVKKALKEAREEKLTEAAAVMESEKIRQEHLEERQQQPELPQVSFAQQQQKNPFDTASNEVGARKEHTNADREITIGYLQGPFWYMVIDNLWGYDASQEILNHLDNLKDNFREAGVSANNTLLRSYRTNTSCYMDSLFPRWSFSGSWEQELQDWPGRKSARAIASPLLKRVDNLFEGNDYMLNELMDHTPYPCSKFRAYDSWETQVSRYGGEPNTADEEGQFYTWHSDRIDGDPRADGRLTSMVYYVHSDPKKFSGGNIVLTDGLIHGGKVISKGSTEVELEPKNDRLVVFNSRTVHMVKPTKTPANTPFRDGRFSINVWCGRMQYFVPGDLF